VIGKEEEMDRNDEVIKQFGERVGYNEAESLL
jgi:acyl-coenzyme A synthetase/AMP-(fatty) acid ligase